LLALLFFYVKDAQKNVQTVFQMIGNAGIGLDSELAEQLLDKLSGQLADDLSQCLVCFSDLETANAVILRGCNHVFCGACL
jgi:hypothetical protein